MKPKIKIITRIGGLLRLCYLISGDVPLGYSCAPHPYREDLIIITPLSKAN